MLCFSWYVSLDDNAILRKAAEHLPCETCIRHAAHLNALCSQQAIGKCGLVQQRLTQDKPASPLGATTAQQQNDITVACNKLLSATCVRQQIEAIQTQQAQGKEADTAAGQHCSKTSTPLDPVAPVHSSRPCDSGATKGCNNFAEPAVACCADELAPAVAPNTDEQSAVAATTASACIRLRLRFTVVLVYCILA